MGSLEVPSSEDETESSSLRLSNTDDANGKTDMQDTGMKTQQIKEKWQSSKLMYNLCIGECVYSHVFL